MGNNNPVSTQQPTEPLSQTTLPPSPQDAGENKQMIFWLIGGLVVIVLVVGGIYWYLNGQSVLPIPPEQTSTPAVTQNKEDLQSEINAIEVDDASADFVQVDKDLESL